MNETIRKGLIIVGMFGLFVMGFGVGCNYVVHVRQKPVTVSIQCSTKGNQPVSFRYDPSTNTMSCETANYTE